MAQPPPGGPTGAPPSYPPAGVPPYPGYPPYAPARPKPPEGQKTILIVIVIVVAIVVVLAVAMIFVLSSLFNGFSNRPIVGFGTAVKANGNVSFAIDSATIVSACSNFLFHLSLGTTSGAEVAVGCTGPPVSESVGGTTYVVTWNDADASGTMTVGDRFTVKGNGVPLASGAYVFYLDWGPGGTYQGFSGAEGWSIP